MQGPNGASHFSVIQITGVGNEQILSVVSGTGISDRTNDGEFQSGTNESGHGCVDGVDEEA
jgi:hypothetical protein